MLNFNFACDLAGRQEWFVDLDFHKKFPGGWIIWGVNTSVGTRHYFLTSYTHVQDITKHYIETNIT